MHRLTTPVRGNVVHAKHRLSSSTMAIADRPNNNDEASRKKAFIYIYLFEPLFNGDGPRIKQR
jgi:hypothetical protein